MINCCRFRPRVAKASFNSMSSGLTATYWLRPGSFLLDGVVLRAVWRVVRHAQPHPQPVRQSLEVLLEQAVRRTVAAAPVTQDQQPLDAWVGCSPILLPPGRHAVATQFARVVARVQV